MNKVIGPWGMIPDVIAGPPHAQPLTYMHTDANMHAYTCIHIHKMEKWAKVNPSLEKSPEPHLPLHITGTLRDERGAFGPCVYSQESWLLSS